MRPSTVFGIFAVSAHAAVLPQVQRYGALTGLTGITGLTSGLTSSLGGLGGLGSLGGLSSLGTSVVGTVGDLLRVPFDLLGPLLGVSVLPCNIDERLCVATCTPNCSGNAQACSDCMLTCFRQSCASSQIPPTPGATSSAPPPATPKKSIFLTNSTVNIVE